MQPIVITVDSKTSWEKFISTHKEANFLSSWNWGEFHSQLGKKIYRLGIYKDQKITGCAQVIVEKAKRATYLTLAGNPLIDWHSPQDFKLIIKRLKKIGNKNKATFVRVRPQIKDTHKNISIFSDQNFKPSPMHLTADLTLQLDLTKSLEDILMDMRKNTRYEIRKSEKINLKITTSQNPQDIDQFYQHQLKLAKKHNFVPFGKKFLKTQFEIFAKDNQVLLISSNHQNKLLAQAFVIFYGQEAVYHYGISTPDNYKLPGSYACQWAAIKEAKKRNLKRYNFWGIAPQNAPKNHRFYGVSLFKRGFGGQEIAYLPTQDLPLSSKYFAVNFFEKIRAKSRHLS
jgi:lipid II:glycine glycyltransferase (peptidoglycan interpeptide bridge formation enzyme)